MITLNYFFDRLKDIKLSDILSIVPMFSAVIISPIYKNKYKNTWLICEEKQEARDNGFWFFKKMREVHPEQKCVYVIDKKSVDYCKVKGIGETVQYGSLKHWILYFTAEYNISSQKGGKPNAALCAFIELNDWYDAHNVFLQHGITINNVTWLYAQRSRIKLFITSAKPEQRFIEECFGYPKGTVVLTGMPRLDNLHQNRTIKNRIVIMPTWRYWFNLKSKQQDGLDKEFLSSEYLMSWKSLLENKKFNKLIEDYNLEVIFYPHRNLQYRLNDMKNNIQTKAIIASWKDYDLQELLITSAMMITDYSSVFFDMVYMKKPVLFYQFDLEKFRKGQYKQGYFDYANNPFGKSYQKAEYIVDELEKMVKNGFLCSEIFEKSHAMYFPYYDTNNSERVYCEIKNIQNKL